MQVNVDMTLSTKGDVAVIQRDERVSFIAKAHSEDIQVVQTLKFMIAIVMRTLIF